MSKLVVYKYPLSDVIDVSTVYAPIVKPLKVDYQKSQFHLWALVDLDEQPKTNEIICIGTGQQIYGNLDPENFLNTTITEEGRLVLHWFVNKIK